jgi:DegV family protein with EDD domain
MIKIFTDTSANLPLELIKEHRIEVIPFPYFIEEQEFTQNLEQDFDGKAFYEAMQNGVLVKTSMINIHTFCEAFEKHLQNGDDIIYIGMSGGISGTANSAKQAVEIMQKKYPQRKIAAIDTKAASLGEGLTVLYGIEMLKQNKSFEEIKEKIIANTKTICQYFTVENLEYLKRSGRISKITAMVGNILNIKPLLKGDDGKIVLFGKIRGRKKALETLATKYKELVSDLHLPIGIAHANSEADADKLQNQIKAIGHKGKVFKVCYEPVTGSHVGPGTIALFFYGNQK